MHARQPEPDPPVTPRHTRRRRRILPRWWVWRALLALVGLVFLVALVTQIVLWTNVPRDLVLRQIQKQLGLRVQAASLSTGWLGDTELRDVTISLPLSDEALLRVPEMRVKHTSLLGLAWTRAVELDLVELRRPYLLVRQDAAGRWNLQEVADLLARTGGKQAATEQARRTTRPELPAVRISDAVVDVVDRGGRRSRISPVNVEGEPEDAVTWKYTAAGGADGTTPATTAPTPRLHVVGRLAPGGTWRHQVDVSAAAVQAWASPFAGDNLPEVAFTGKWEGEVRDGVTGRLVLDSLALADTNTAGAVAVRTESGVVSIRPENLIVRTSQKLVPELRVTAGRIALDGKSAAAEQLTVLTFEGAALVNARYDWATGSADLRTDWSDFAVPGQKITHGGSLTASVRHPFPRQPVVSAQLVSNGTMPSGSWQAEFDLGGRGPGWANMDWEVQARRLTVTGPYAVRADGLAAGVQTSGPIVSLTNLRGPGDVVARGRGDLNLDSRDWDLRLDVSNLPRPMTFGRQGPLAITLAAHGNSEYVSLREPGLSLRGSDAEVRVEGAYVYDVPKPVDVTVHINHIPPRIEANDAPPLFGYLRGQARVTGTVWPIDLAIAGNFVGRDVRLGNRSIGDLEAGLTGRADAERLAIQSEKLKLLGGEWQLHALFPEQGVLGVNLAVDNLPLKEVGGAVNRPDLEGTVDARWAVLVPRLAREAVKITADIKGRGLKLDKLSADQLDATVVLAGGELRADPVRLRKGAGEANVAVAMDVREFRRLMVSLDLAAWPFEPSPGTKAELWGGTTGLRVSLPGATRAEGIRRGVYRPESKAQGWWVTGPLDLRAAFTLKDQPAGDAHLLADMRGRTIDLRSLSYDGLDGTVQAQGIVDLDRVFEARGSLFFEDFNAASIPGFFPENAALVGLNGRFSGRARVGPAAGARPLEPVRIQGEVTSNGGKYRSVDVGPIQFSMFTNFDRLVIEDSAENPTTLALAGGLVRVWGRLTRLEPGEELNVTAASRPLFLSQMQVSFGRLDLDQIVHAFKPDADPMVGKLSGSFEALAGTRPRRRPGAPPSGQGPFEKVVRRITADGRVDLVESDLANLDVVAALYNALSVSPDAKQPEGRGGLTFHLEDGLISLNDVRYFNRGTEIRAIADIDEVWRMPDSPVEGTAVGTARPFRDIKLPFLSTYDLDSILTVLQTDLTTVRTTGSVRSPVIQPLAFSDLGEGMRMFILGDFKQADRKERRR